MCLSSPKIPAPVQAQEQKTPDSINEFRRKKTGAPMAGSTLLTGSQGIATGAANTGSATLLGG